MIRKAVHQGLDSQTRPHIVKWASYIVMVWIGVLMNGCASYKGQPLPPPGALSLAATVEGVTVRVEPFSAEQARAAFDTNPEAIRILFVRVLLQNEGEQSYLTGRYQARLMTRQGVTLTPVSPSRIARKTRASHDSLAAGSLLLFGILSYPSFQSANEASDAMVKDLTDKSFPEQVELAPRSTLGGVLYFELPSYVTARDCVRVDVILRPRSGGDHLEVQVPLLAGSEEG
jgi:hypothetical protein